MIDADEFIETFLEHRKEYDPVAAREYYLRTRKLKGRKAGPPKPMSKGKKSPKRIEEDEAPATSPSGAKMIDFEGKGSGRATYADGSTFDGNGWNSTGHKINTRLNAAQQQLMKARAQASKMTDPAQKKRYLTRLAELQKSLNAAKNKQGNDRKTGTIS